MPLFFPQLITNLWPRGSPMPANAMSSAVEPISPQDIKYLQFMLDTGRIHSGRFRLSKLMGVNTTLIQDCNPSTIEYQVVCLIDNKSIRLNTLHPVASNELWNKFAWRINRSIMRITIDHPRAEKLFNTCRVAVRPNWPIKRDKKQNADSAPQEGVQTLANNDTGLLYVRPDTDPDEAISRQIERIHQDQMGRSLRSIGFM